MLEPNSCARVALTADTEAYFGHLIKARELTRQAVDFAVRADNKKKRQMIKLMPASGVALRPVFSICSEGIKRDWRRVLHRAARVHTTKHVNEAVHGCGTKVIRLGGK